MRSVSVVTFAAFAAFVAKCEGAPLTDGSMLALRVCAEPRPAAVSATNVTCPLVVEEWSIEGPPTLLQTIALPTQTIGSQFACTGLGALGDVSGSLTMSRARMSVTLGCFAIPPQVGGGIISFPPSSFPRVIARIYNDGSVDTSIGLTDPYNGQNSNFLSTLADDVTVPNRYYITGTLTSFGGLRMATQSGPTTAIQPSGFTMRALVTDGSSLYGSYSGNNFQQGVLRFTGSGVTGGSTSFASLWPTNSTAFTATNVVTGLTAATGTGNLGDSRAPNAGTPFFQNSGRMWLADCTLGLNVYDRNAAGLFSYSRTFRGPANETFRFAAGRNTSTGGFTIIATQCVSPWALWHFDSATFVFTKIADPAAGSAYKGVSSAPLFAPPTTTPSRTPTPSPSNSRSPSASVTPSNSVGAEPTPTTTPTPTNVIARFASGNILVARTDATANVGPGRYAALFLDEIDPISGVMVSTVALPTEQVLNNDGSVRSYRCTQPVSFNLNEGFVQTTTDGTAVTLPCYDGAVGSVVSPTVRRVFAAVFASGLIDTTTSCADCFNGTTGSVAIRGASSADVFSGFVATSYLSVTSASAGVRFIPFGGSSSVQLSGLLARYVRIEPSLVGSPGGPVLAATIANSGIQYVPLTAVNEVSRLSRPVVWTPLAGHNSTFLSTSTIGWQYVVNPDGNRLFMLDQRFFSQYNMITFAWDNDAQRWALTNQTLAFDSVASVQSAVGVTTDPAGFSLAVASGNRVWLHNTVTGARRVLYAAPFNTSFYGVANVPVDARIWPASRSVTPSNSPSSSMAPSTSSSVSLTSSASATPSMGSSLTASPSNTGTNTASITGSRTGTAASTATRTNTPSLTASPSNTRSNTASMSVSGSVSASRSASPTVATPSPTPTNVIARFASGNILVARTDATPSIGSGRYAALFLDEIDPVSGAIVSTTAMPTEQTFNEDGSVRSYRCTQQVSFMFGEGFVQTTTDGTAVTLPCYDAAVGTTFTWAVRRVFAAVFADGRIDTTTSCADCFTATTGSVAIRGASSADVFSGFVATSYLPAASSNSGVRYIAYGGNTSVQLSGQLARYVRVEASLPGAPAGPVLAASIAGVGIQYVPLATVTGMGSLTRPVVWTPLAGLDLLISTTIGWQFAVTPDGLRLYLADSRAPSIHNVIRMDWDAGAARWVLSNETLSFDTSSTSVQGLVGVTSNPSGFTLAVSSSNRVWAHNTATGARRVLYAAPFNTSFYGMSRTPVDARIIAASRSETPSNSQSPSVPPTSSTSPSLTSTPSATLSGGASQSSSPSDTSTPTASLTGSRTGTAAVTRSRTGSGTASPPPTGTATNSGAATGTATSSGTATGTTSVTASRSGTGSASSTSTGTRSATASVSGSRTGTPSTSGTRTRTPTPTITDTASVSATASETASVSATQTGTSSPSQTQTGTPSASGTGTGTPSPSATVTGSSSASATGTRTGTPSASGTGAATTSGSRSATATGTSTAAATATKTRVALPSVSPTRTRTRTASRTKTKTRTRTRTPSKKK